MLIEKISHETSLCVHNETGKLDTEIVKVRAVCQQILDRLIETREKIVEKLNMYVYVNRSISP